MERLRRINESEANIAANEARLLEMERSMKEREQQLELERQELSKKQREQEALLEQRSKQQQQQQQEQASVQPPSELFHNPFEAPDEPLIRNYDVHDSQQNLMLLSDEAGAKVDTRTAHAILRHDLSSNHQENINPFEDPSTLISNASLSARSSVQGEDDEEEAFADAEDRSVNRNSNDNEDDEDDLDWTEAEVGSVGSHESDESDESWGSP